MPNDYVEDGKVHCGWHRRQLKDGVCEACQISEWPQAVWGVEGNGNPFGMGGLPTIRASVTDFDTALEVLSSLALSVGALAEWRDILRQVQDLPSHTRERVSLSRDLVQELGTLLQQRDEVRIGRE